MQVAVQEKQRKKKMYSISRERSLREDQRLPIQRRKTPSFSSSLLDSIYRSIDNDVSTTTAAAVVNDDEFSLYLETTTTTTAVAMIKKQSITTTTFEEGEEDDRHELSSLRRAIMIEKWTEKHRIEKEASRRFNSASDSSDSSSGGGGGGAFSSSETESSSYRARSTTSCFTPIRSRPFRTRASSTRSDDQSEKQSKGGGGFARTTKLRAMKIYGDLKMAKSKDQPPISPGRRIASFLNSLFNAKKEKLCSVDALFDDTTLQKKSQSQSATTTPCSTASSFSRSCLSKTPSSATGKLSSFNGGGIGNGTKRSVRFYPMTVIVDEDCRPCGQKLVSATPFLTSEELKNNVEQARDILREFQEKKKKSSKKYGFEVRDFRDNGVEDDEDDDDDDDDVESYASSDLFEIENLIGSGRCREELPVYETTNLKTNQAIAHGLIL